MMGRFIVAFLSVLLTICFGALLSWLLMYAVVHA